MSLRAQSVLRVAGFVVGTLVVWAGLWAALWAILTVFGESPLHCEEGREEFCGPVTHFWFDSFPLMPLILLAAAAGVIRGIARPSR